MIKFVYIFLLVFFATSTTSAQDTEKKRLRDEEGVVLVDVLFDSRLTPDELENIYIPEDIADCIAQLNIILPDTTKSKIKKLTEMDFLAYSHFGLGRWIVNAWGLHNSSRLSAYFNSKGVVLPNDMATIVQVSYYRSLKGKDIGFAKQADDFSRAYLLNKKPGKEIYPKEIEDMDIRHALGFRNKDGDNASLFVGKAAEDYWMYGYNYGWTKITESDFRKVEKGSIKSRRKIIEKIYKNNKL